MSYERWNWPLLSISLPCLTQRACACLCLVHKCSWWAAWLLLPWAAAAPAPSPSCLPRREKASPFTAQIEKVRRRNAVVSAISASSDRSWPRLPSCGLATCTLDLARWTIKVWVAAETSVKAPATSPSTSPTDASFLSSFSVLLDASGYIKQLPKHNQDTFFVVCSSFTMLWHQFQLEMWLGLIATYWNSTGWRKALSGAIMNFYMITAVYKNMWNFVLLE